METNELTLKLSQKAEDSQSWERIKVEDRFFNDFFKGAGFKFESSIAELIDNSISAGATIVAIKTKLVGENIYNITIEDNGSGITPDKIKSIMNLGSGNLSEYKSNSISYYGVGMKFSLKNLCNSGICNLTSVSNGLKSSIMIDCEGVPRISEPITKKISDKNQTKIEIPNVRVTSNKITSLLKFLGVSYFPHVDNGNDLKILLNHNGDTKEVIFTDPLYRNLKTESANSIKSNDSVVEIDGRLIKIKARVFGDFNNDDYSPWDIRQGGIGWSGPKSGVYFRLNGRYITLGEGKFYVSKSEDKVETAKAGSTRIRIEVDIDRDLIKLMGISFNKSKIDPTDDEKIKPFLTELHNLVSWAVKEYNSKKDSNPSISEESKAENEEINRDLNAIRRKMNNDFDENAPEFEEEDKEPKGSKKRPKGLKYEKHEKDSLKFKFGPLYSDRAFDYCRTNGVLVITYNTNHEFYKIFNKLSKESKKLIHTYTIALCDSFNMTKNYVSIDYEIYDGIISDILSSFSRRLQTYNKD